MNQLEIKRRASKLLQRGRYEEAIAEYQVLLEGSKKKHPAILNIIGDIYIKKGAYEQGFQYFLSASKSYCDEGLFHNGIAVAKKILRLDREQVEVYGSLGILYARQGLGMDCVKFLNEYARLKEAAEETPAALAALAEACEILPDAPEIHISYADKLVRADRPEDAAVCYEKAAELYSERGLESFALEMQRRSQIVRGAGEIESQTEAAADVSDIMSLRALDGESLGRAERPAGGDSSERDSDPGFGDPGEPAGLFPPAGAGPAVEDLLVVYDPLRNPDLPPPPPLPSLGEESSRPVEQPLELATGSASPPEPAESPELEAGPVAPSEHPPGGDAPLELPDREIPPLPRAADPLELAGEGTLSPPAVAMPDSPADPPGPPPAEEARAPVVSGLGNLPGIIMPPSRQGELLPPPPPLPPREPDLEDRPIRHRPEIEMTPTADRAVVIGDDFELVREGGDVSEVIADFREATDDILDLDDHRAHYDLGTTYLEMDLFEEAAAEFEIASRGKSLALPSREMLGYCFLRQGKIDLAIRELKKDLETPEYSDAEKLGLYYNLGIACGVLDQEDDAIAYFQRILETDENFRDTRQRLERLLLSSS